MIFIKIPEPIPLTQEQIHDANIEQAFVDSGCKFIGRTLVNFNGHEFFMSLRLNGCTSIAYCNCACREKEPKQLEYIQTKLLENKSNKENVNGQLQNSSA